MQSVRIIGSSAGDWNGEKGGEGDRCLVPRKTEAAEKRILRVSSRLQEEKENQGEWAEEECRECKGKVDK